MRLDDNDAPTECDRAMRNKFRALYLGPKDALDENATKVRLVYDKALFFVGGR